MTRIEQGKAIRAERKLRYMTQAEAGKALGCCSTTIGCAERGVSGRYSERGYKHLQTCLLSRLKRLHISAETASRIHQKASKKSTEEVQVNIRKLLRVERRDAMQQLADEGMSITDIGKQFGVSKQRMVVVDEISYIRRHDRSMVITYGNLYTTIPDQAIVMQYTGLRDKNGREIYEGDILQFDPDEWGSPDGIWAVTFNTDSGEWDTGGGTNSECVEFKTVLGNVYENPELIKDGE